MPEIGFRGIPALTVYNYRMFTRYLFLLLVLEMPGYKVISYSHCGDYLNNHTMFSLFFLKYGFAYLYTYDKEMINVTCHLAQIVRHCFCSKQTTFRIPLLLGSICSSTLAKTSQQMICCFYGFYRNGKK